ncbi:hypothetical protein ES332_D10G114400v1 [Gossypium tomentosum]|uniref:Uncharacterized protein n=1 Tax=Gossypium tomentosum TaxID=34277 RepID=A0A5D2J3U2_GOSTO|nr:hypothetical protein ES332_D10G114400v1 [Gossypium tomentosum]
MRSNVALSRRELKRQVSNLLETAFTSQDDSPKTQIVCKKETMQNSHYLSHDHRANPAKHTRYPSNATILKGFNT